MTRCRLTIIVPAFNEAPSIDAILGRLRELPFDGFEVIVVDDGSGDETPELLKKWEGMPGWQFLYHATNRGKGAAVRTGLAHAAGDVAIVQDADEEYDPADIPAVVESVLSGRELVVFGSRYLDGTRNVPWTRFRLAVRFLNDLSRLLYGQHLTDQATCYKAMPLWLWKALDLRANRFELCAEITAKLGRWRIPIREVPIRYSPRSRADGKKIGWRDALSAVATLLQWRFRALEKFPDCQRTAAKLRRGNPQDDSVASTASSHKQDEDRIKLLQTVGVGIINSPR